MTDSPTHADADLIVRCLEQDAAAWETLLWRYQRLVASITYKYGLTPEDSADVLQSVFMTLYQQLDTLRAQDKLSSWIITIAVRECWKLRHRGKSVLSSSISLDDPDNHETAQQLTDEQPLPDTILLELERQHTLRRAVTDLAEPCRTLLTELFYRDEPQPYAELSLQLAMPVASIGPTRARCLNKLKSVLEQKKKFSAFGIFH
jgi:RNA polymerase sigma factor (sigma-70 family)